MSLSLLQRVALAICLATCCGVAGHSSVSAECRETCTDYEIASFVSDPNTEYHCCYVGGTYVANPPASDPGDACDGRHDPELACPDTAFWYDLVGCWLGGDETPNYQCNPSAFTRTFKLAMGVCIWDEEEETVDCVLQTNPMDPGVQVTKYECAECES